MTEEQENIYIGKCTWSIVKQLPDKAIVKLSVSSLKNFRNEALSLKEKEIADRLKDIGDDEEMDNFISELEGEQ